MLPLSDGARTVDFLDPVDDRDAWLEMRRQGIGASDIPILLDLDEYKTALDLYRDKLGESDDYDSDAARMGRIFEDAIAGDWANQRNLMVKRSPTVRHANTEWAFASPDRRVLGCRDHRGGCGLEVKCRSAWQAGRWREEIPSDVEAQCQWQLYVTGWDAIHVAAVIGGNKPEYRYTVVPDAGLIDDLVQVASEFWECVQNRTPPTVDYDGRLIDSLQRMFPTREGETEVPALKAGNALHRLSRAKICKAAAENVIDRAKAELIHYLGSSQVGRINGQPAYSYKNGRPRRINAELLRDMFPDVADMVTARSDQWILRPTKEWK
jgi:putative phage-type endonuclease